MAGVELVALIEGGYYLKARCIQESEIAHAPPHVREIWDWLIKECNHEDRKHSGIIIKRGQCVRSYSDIIDGLHWMVGWRKMSYSKHDCETAMKWLKKRTMITTMKTTRGMVITILNYDKYQNPDNYENHTKIDTATTRKPQSRHTINKNEKNIRINKKPSSSNDEVELDFLITRKKKKLNGKRFETFMRFWDAFEYKSGRAEAADAWLEIPELTNSVVEKIIWAAKIEAKRRPALKQNGKTPKMAQGWISGRRWEDESYKSVKDLPNYLTPEKIAELNS